MVSPLLRRIATTISAAPEAFCLAGQPGLVAAAEVGGAISFLI